jgi:hypothetical protein
MRHCLALAVLWSAAATLGGTPAAAQQTLPITARVSARGRLFKLEVARTPLEQQLGLMYRTELAPDRGMLFVFEPARPTAFWMRNTLIPLDMVFAHKGKIVDIRPDVPPCRTPECPTYGPAAAEAPIDMVFEFNAGTAHKIGLKPGDRLKVEFLRPAASQARQ